MKKVGFVYDDVFLRHETPHYHPERRERLIAIVQALKESHLWEGLVHLRPLLADLGDIEAVHDPRYVARIRDSEPAYLDPDTYLSPYSFEAARYAAGALISAVNSCLGGEIERVFCAVRPPGHHAEAGRAMGFCIFNNVAVGARYAQRMGFRKVFIVDFDVHHGNGTEHMFYEDETVFYFSTHQYPHYPGTGSDRERGRGKGEGFTYNVPMRAHSGDEEYIAIYSALLPQLVREFDPDIMVVSAGYDMHEGDPLAAVRVSDEGTRQIVHSIIGAKRGIPCIFSLEGGYDLGALGRGVTISIGEMLNAH